MRRILLLGYFGAGNLGDDCLLADFLLAHEDWLRARDLRVDVVGSGSEPLAGFIERPRLEGLVGQVLDRRTLLRSRLGDYAALVLPGGSVLQDSTSLRSLLYYLEVFRRATAAGVPACLLHQGIGPLSSWLAKVLTPRWLRRSSMLSLRDPESYEWARRRVGGLAGGAQPQHSADPVLAGRLAAPAELLPPALQPGSYVLCIPRRTGDLPHRGDATEEAAALARLLSHAAAHTGLPLVLASFQGSMDADFVAAVSSHIEATATVYQHRGDEQQRASALLSLVQHSALLIGYRLHSLVLAAAGGVPALGVAYDPKVSSFCAEFGYPCCYPAEVHEQSTFELLSSLWDEREEVMAECAHARQAALARLHVVEEQLHLLL